MFQLFGRGRRAGGAPELAVPIDREELLAHCAELCRQVGELCRRGEVRPDERLVLTDGCARLHELVPAAVRAALERADDGEPSAVWLRLRGWATQVPWEWAWGPEGPWFRRYALGREIPVEGGAGLRAPAALATPAPCVIVGDPAGDLPAARVEVEAVHHCLRAAGLRPRTQGGRIAIEDLRGMLRAAQLVHIAAHVDAGDPEQAAPGPSIRCGDGALHASELAALSVGALCPALVVLNGCGSAALAPAFLGCGCGHVVACLTDIGDDVAGQAAVGLYRALSRGASMGEALRLARADQAEWIFVAPYVLYGDPTADILPAFPSAEDSSGGDESRGPRAWVAAVVQMKGVGVDDSLGDELEEHRDELIDCIEAAGTIPREITPDGVLVDLGLAEFGDRYVDAAATLARRLASLKLGSSNTWGRGRMAVGVGVASAGHRARQRAMWLADQASGGAVIVDDRVRATCRLPDVRFGRLPGAPAASPTWDLTSAPSDGGLPRSFVGRRSALSDLLEALDESRRSGLPELTVLQGATGIGKTTLLQALTQQLLGRGDPVVHARAGLLDSFDVERLPAGKPVQVEGFVRQLVAASVGEDPGPDPWAWADAMRRLDRVPTWLIDAVELLPGSFDRELEALLDELEELPLYVVVAIRGDTRAQTNRAEGLAARAATGVNVLRPLRPAACRSLVEQRLGVESLPGDLEPVVRQSGGNPLLLLEAVDQLRRSGQLDRASPGLTVDPMSGAVGPAPSPLEEALVAARLLRVDPEVRRIVEATAVLGGEAPREALESMPWIDPLAIPRAVTDGWLRLRMAASWQGREPWCSLRDPVVARVLPALIPPLRSRALHDGALAWHEARESAPAQRAHHALRSSDPLQAIPSLWEDAEACHEGGDFEGALSAISTIERLVSAAPEDALPVGTPPAPLMRALSEASERMRQAEGDPTSTSVLSFHLTGGFEPFSGRQLGRYRLLDMRGVNRTGVRYLAEQSGAPGFRRKVELLVLHRQLGSSEVFREALVAEIGAVAALSHPNIAAALDLGCEDGAWFVATDHAPGVSVKRLLKNSPNGLPADIAVCLAAGIAEGLAHAHGRPAGAMVHRAICPDTLFVTRDGVPRVRDFGLDPATDAMGSPAETGALRGRVGYVAPERVHGRAVGPAADLWGLGVVLFELLTGDRLFRGKTIQDVLHAMDTQDSGPLLDRVEEIDPVLAAWLRQMVERNPDARPDDTGTLAAELLGIASRLSPLEELPNRRLAGLVNGLLKER